MVLERLRTKNRSMAHEHFLFAITELFELVGIFRFAIDCHDDITAQSQYRYATAVPRANKVSHHENPRL